MGNSGYAWWEQQGSPGSVPNDAEVGDGNRDLSLLLRGLRLARADPEGGLVGWGPSSYPAVFGCWSGVSNTAG